MSFKFLDYLVGYENEDVDNVKKIIESKKSKIDAIIKEAFYGEFVSKAEAAMRIKDEFINDKKAPKTIDTNFLKENLESVISKVESLTEGEIKIVVNNYESGSKSKLAQPTTITVDDSDDDLMGFESTGAKKRKKSKADAAATECAKKVAKKNAKNVKDAKIEEMVDNEDEQIELEQSDEDEDEIVDENVAMFVVVAKNQGEKDKVVSRSMDRTSANKFMKQLQDNGSSADKLMVVPDTSIVKDESVEVEEDEDVETELETLKWSDFQNFMVKEEDDEEEEEEELTEDSEKINQKDYVYWVVASGKIITGWEYREDAIDHMKELKDESDVLSRVYSRIGLKKLGLDPEDNNDWGSEIDAKRKQIATEDVEDVEDIEDEDDDIEVEIGEGRVSEFVGDVEDDDRFNDGEEIGQDDMGIDDEPVVDSSDDVEVEDEPIADSPNDEDCFITDNTRGGYDVSCGGEFMDHAVEFEDALGIVKNWQEENQFYPTIWSVNERGDYTAIDTEGNEISDIGETVDEDNSIDSFLSQRLASFGTKKKSMFEMDDDIDEIDPIDDEIVDENIDLTSIKIYDNGGESVDRYTVYFTNTKNRDNTYNCLAMSSDPFSPQGFGQHSTGQLGRHNGKEITFDQLPQDCKQMVMDEFGADENVGE